VVAPIREHELRGNRADAPGKEREREVIVNKENGM